MITTETAKYISNTFFVYSDDLRLGPGVDLFNFLADCVLDFLRSEGMEKDELSLGNHRLFLFICS